MDGPLVSDFPQYCDGDVVVLIGLRQKYQLHASVLRRNSPYFTHLLSPNHAVTLNQRARKEGRIVHYQLELTGCFVAGNVPRDPFSLVPLDSYGMPLNSRTKPFESDNGKAPIEDHKAWDSIFSLFYNRALKIDDTTLEMAVQDCVNVISLAETIHAAPAVREHLDLALIRFGSRLYEAIARNPVAWIDLACRIQSPSIFKESITHTIGKWNMIPSSKLETLSPEIRDLCQRKFQELDLAKEAIEMRILGHYPEVLTRNVHDKPGRGAYSTEIYLWMALCFFRQWYAQAINDERTRHAEDGGFMFFKTLEMGGDAYLTHEDMRNFHQYFPMSSKACHILENNVKIIKDDMKYFVAEFFVNRTSIDPATFKLEWLTCCVVEKEDFPWEKVINAGTEPGADDAINGHDVSMTGDEGIMTTEP